VLSVLRVREKLLRVVLSEVLLAGTADVGLGALVELDAGLSVALNLVASDVRFALGAGADDSIKATGNDSVFVEQGFRPDVWVVAYYDDAVLVAFLYCVVHQF